MDAVAITEGLEPLAVWDTHERLGPWRAGGDEDREERWALMTGATDWAKQQHIERLEDTYRVEFYLLDMPFGVVYRHMRIFGRLVWNPETRRPHEEEPVIVPLAELPPEHLLKG